MKLKNYEEEKPMKRTNVFATEEELKSLKSRVNQPAIVLQAGSPPSAAELAHRLALEHGLPEITGYYGCDLETGEFLST